MDAISSSVFSPQSSSSFRSILPILFTISAVALAIIGLLALLQVSVFYAVSSYWYCFEIGALMCIALTCISCCCKKSSAQTIGGSNEDSPHVNLNHNVNRVTYVPRQQHQTQSTQPPPKQNPAPQIVLTEKSDPNVLFKTARTYVQGKKEADKDYVSAVQLYQWASDQGHALASLHLAKCYEKGKGAEPLDLDRALFYYERAAAQSNLESIYALAWYAFEQNKKDAGIEWLEKAAELLEGKGKESLENLIENIKKIDPKDTRCSVIKGMVRLSLTVERNNRKMRQTLVGL